MGKKILNYLFISVIITMFFTSFTILEVNAINNVNKNAAVKMAAPKSITVKNIDGKILINWTKVATAKKYQIIIKNGTKQVLNKQVTALKYDATKIIKSPTKYSIYVYSVGNTSYNKSSARSKSFTLLAQPKKVFISNNEYDYNLTWTKVATATNYKVNLYKVVGKKKTLVDTIPVKSKNKLSLNKYVTKYSTNNYLLSATVTAHGNSKTLNSKSTTSANLYIPLNPLKINQENISLKMTDKLKITVNSTLKVEYKSLDESVIIVDNKGNITPVALGFANVMVIDEYLNTAIAAVNVVDELITSITLEKDKIEFTNFTPQTLITKITPETVKDKTVDYTSSDERIASVDNMGVITPNSSGFCNITATTSNGLIAICEVLVNVNYVEPTVTTGSYKIRKANTNLYLNCKNTDTTITDGSDVTIDTINTSLAQSFYIDSKPNNTALIFSLGGSNKVVDVFRGTNNSVDIGDNINIWNNDDPKAQEFIFLKQPNGNYIIALNSMSNAVLTTYLNNAGDSVMLGLFDSLNPNIEWVLEPITAMNDNPNIAGINDDAVFIKQDTTYTCTLAAVTMLYRRLAILKELDYTNITEASLRTTFWAEGVGIYHDLSYNGDKVVIENIKGTALDKKNYLISVLNTRPEGIVIYNRSAPHAVLLTDYNPITDMFMAVDPAKNTLFGRIPLSLTSIIGNSQDEKLNSIVSIWKKN